MTPEMLKARLRQESSAVERYLATCMHERDIPEGLLKAMEYSLLAGGKRLRPVLCITVANMFGVATEDVLPFAASIECIHTYSLMHDDLPAMDDDDLRRGKPTSHIVFGEATAILAGDALLTEAFTLMTEVAGSIPAEHVLAAVRTVSTAAGAAGMVGGQQIDMEFTGREGVSLKELQNMHARKTGALLCCSCLTGAMLAGASEDDIAMLRTYGESIGVAFQIVDDVLDIVGDESTLGKPVGSDEEEGKNTYPSLLGIEKSRVLAQEYADIAKAQLENFSGPEAEFLTALAQYIVDRAM